MYLHPTCIAYRKQKVVEKYCTYHQMFLEESFSLSCASYLLTFLYMVSKHLWISRLFIDYIYFKIELFL